jgi:hypothetical protein
MPTLQRPRLRLLDSANLPVGWLFKREVGRRKQVAGLAYATETGLRMFHGSRIAFNV